MDSSWRSGPWCLTFCFFFGFLEVLAIFRFSQGFGHLPKSAKGKEQLSLSYCFTNKSNINFVCQQPNSFFGIKQICRMQLFGFISSHLISDSQLMSYCSMSLYHPPLQASGTPLYRCFFGMLMFWFLIFRGLTRVL